MAMRNQTDKTYEAYIAVYGASPVQTLNTKSHPMSDCGKGRGFKLARIDSEGREQAFEHQRARLRFVGFVRTRVQGLGFRV